MNNKNKVLISVLLSTCFTVPALAAIPSGLTISGSSAFAVHGVQQKRRMNKSKGYHSSVESSSICFTYANQSDAGHEHKIVANMNATPSVPNGPNPNIFNQMYMQFRGPAGTLQMGNVYSIPETMCLAGGDILAGNGGFNSYYGSVFNNASYVLTGTDMSGNVGSATKVTYLTPRFALWNDKPVLQVGVDFTPNSQHYGSAPLVTNRSQTSYSQGDIYGVNTMGFGVNYMDDFDNWQVQVALCGVRGTAYDGRQTAHIGDFRNANKANRHVLRPYRSWEIGAHVGYKDTQLAAGYVHNGKSAIQKPGVTIDPTNQDHEQFSGGNAGRLINVGLAQNYGPARASIGFQNNTMKITARDRTRCRVVSVGGEYTIGEGLVAFIDNNIIKHDTTRSAILLSDLNGGEDVNPIEYPRLTVDSNKGFTCAGGLKVYF